MLDIKGVNLTYPDGTEALCGVDLHVADGESVAIVGANGAGKSTLLLSIVGINIPSSGSVRVGGVEVKKDSLREIRYRVGIVFQNPDDQLFMPSIYDDIAFGPRNYGLSEEDVEKRVTGVLEALHAMHLKDKTPHKLSYGERRVAAIGSVLAMEPSVLLMDEPSSFLDPKARRTLIGLLTGLPLAKVIATHDLDMALDLCERAIVLKKGKVFADGPAKDVLLDKALLEASGLEMPLCCLRRIES